MDGTVGVVYHDMGMLEHILIILNICIIPVDEKHCRYLQVLI